MREVLVGDIGGTHARFGIVDADGRLGEDRVLECARYPSLVAAATDYLSGRDAGSSPRLAAVAVACPVLEDQVHMTNHPWSFSVAATCRALGLETLEVLNDFTALALAVPTLRLEDTRELRPGRPRPRAPIGVMGPGTGLGVSVLVPLAQEQQWLALPCEGGHRDLAAGNEREWRIVEWLHARFGHVSAERVVSGPGLVNLHEAIRDLDGQEPRAREPAEVVAGAVAEGCPSCREAVAIFSRQLGALAGDLVLTLGARGGVFIGGGVLRGMGSAFDVDLFNDGFLAKGRFREYLEPIPVRRVLDPTAALVGAAHALDYQFSAGVRHAMESSGGATSGTPRRISRD